MACRFNLMNHVWFCENCPATSHVSDLAKTVSDWTALESFSRALLKFLCYGVMMAGDFICYILSDDVHSEHKSKKRYKIDEAKAINMLSCSEVASTYL